MRLQIGADGADRLRAAEVSAHGHDQVLLLERLHELIVLLGGQKALRLTGRIERPARQIREPDIVAASTSTAPASRDAWAKLREGLDHRRQLPQLVCRERES